jgi:hypothetical protein
MEDELVGLWSADYMYGSGAHSDEVLIFWDDGNGRLDFINLVLCTVYKFRWTVSSPNHLTLIGTKTYQIGDDGISLEESEDIINVKGVSFQIAIEDTPSRKTMRVLRVKLMANFSDHFGFVHKDFNKLKKFYLD